MKRLSLLVVFTGLILTVSSNEGLAGDCCCPKKCFTMPRLLPRLKSLCCRPKCDPCAACCVAAPTCVTSAPTTGNAPTPPAEQAPQPAELTPSAADQPKK